MQTPDVITLLQNLLNRPVDTHKYDYGHVLVIGGSKGMVGAPFMAARAALRAGAGLVSIAAEDTAGFIQQPELLTHEIQFNASDASDNLLQYIDDRKVSTIVIGPGLYNTNFIRKLTSMIQVPTILDGGVFAAYQRDLPALASNAKNAPLVLTPHEGELRTLTSELTPNEQSDRQQFVQTLASEHGLTILLKGPNTIVAGPASQLFVNTTGNAGMATAGSGDVLSGIIAGLSAQGLQPFEAAAIGAYIHGFAGDIAVNKKTSPGLIASDIISALPLAYKVLSASTE